MHSLCANIIPFYTRELTINQILVWGRDLRTNPPQTLRKSCCIESKYSHSLLCLIMNIKSSSCIFSTPLCKFLWNTNKLSWDIFFQWHGNICILLKQKRAKSMHFESKQPEFYFLGRHWLAVWLRSIIFSAFLYAFLKKWWNHSFIP